MSENGVFAMAGDLPRDERAKGGGGGADGKGKGKGGGRGSGEGRHFQGDHGDENRRIEGERRREAARKGAEEWLRVRRKVQGPSQAPEELPGALEEQRKAGSFAISAICPLARKQDVDRLVARALAPIKEAEVVVAEGIEDEVWRGKQGHTMARVYVVKGTNAEELQDCMCLAPRLAKNAQATSTLDLDQRGLEQARIEYTGAEAS